jgi:mannose-1-phosphate guanylyltransferase
MARAGGRTWSCGPTAILYPPLRVENLAGGDVPVAIFPSDHEIAEDAAFATYVTSAIDVARAAPERVVLLGMEPDRPETEYGWIEPAEMPLPLDGEPAFPVGRFLEKPSAGGARALFARGCLWNSLVMVGWVSAFRAMLSATVPDLLAAFAPLMTALATPREPDVADRVSTTLPEINFSEQVLVRSVERLLVMRVKNVGWSDLGNPARVLASLRRTGRRPAWLGDPHVDTTA